MNDQIALITFGCSWTYGVGVGYKDGMLDAEFREIAWDDKICNKLSFRGVLSKKYNLYNINFSHGGSSNQRQFRLATEFFLSPKFKKIQNDYSKIIVLWGITSTARSEYFSVIDNNLKNFKFDFPDTSFEKMFVKYAYDHDYEVYRLKLNMIFWNEYFTNNKISNIWVDTFNHHNYKAEFNDPIIKEDYNSYRGADWPTWDQFLLQNYSNINKTILKEIEQRFYLKACPDRLFNADIPNRDLLSQLAIKNGLLEFESTYHLSTGWKVDCDKVEFLKDRQILDPISLHPTPKGHEQIAEMFYQLFDKIVDE
jgi:hypothetical protein